MRFPSYDIRTTFPKYGILFVFVVFNKAKLMRAIWYFNSTANKQIRGKRANITEETRYVQSVWSNQAKCCRSIEEYLCNYSVKNNDLPWGFRSCHGRVSQACPGVWIYRKLKRDAKVRICHARVLYFSPSTVGEKDLFALLNPHSDGWPIPSHVHAFPCQLAYQQKILHARRASGFCF